MYSLPKGIQRWNTENSKNQNMEENDFFVSENTFYKTRLSVINRKLFEQRDTLINMLYLTKLLRRTFRIWLTRAKTNANLKKLCSVMKSYDFTSYMGFLMHPNITPHITLLDLQNFPLLFCISYYRKKVLRKYFKKWQQCKKL